MRVNQAIVGLFLGIITPILGIVVAYFVWGQGQGIPDFVQGIFARSSAASKIITLCMCTNLIPFLYFSRKRLDQTVKGIVIATCLYAVFVLYVKFMM
jgi:amino acid permease